MILIEKIIMKENVGNEHDNDNDNDIVDEVDENDLCISQM